MAIIRKLNPSTGKYEKVPKYKDNTPMIKLEKRIRDLEIQVSALLHQSSFVTATAHY